MWRKPIAEHLLPGWIDRECERGPNLFERAGALYDAWRAYAHARHAEPGSPSEFAAAMEGRGYQCDRLRGERHRIRWGLRLRSRGGVKSSADVAAPAPPSFSFGDFFQAGRDFKHGNAGLAVVSAGGRCRPQKNNREFKGLLAAQVARPFAMVARAVIPPDFLRLVQTLKGD